MNGELILFLGRRTLETGLLIAAPTLIVALGVGILVSLFQAVTSIRDMSLNMVIKIAAVGVTLIVASGWILQMILGFTMDIFDTIKAITQ
jgi:flagellar biosynthetic protein FliQ